MEDLQYSVLRIYAKKKLNDPKDCFVNSVSVLAIINQDEKFYNVQLLEVVSVIKRLRLQMLINQHPDNRELDYITTFGERVFYSEATKIEIQNEKEKLQNKLLKVSIQSNIWSPRWAALAAVFALCSVVIAWISYKKSNHEQSVLKLQHQDSTLQQTKQY
ncbi:MAG TPA: hypothetical protein PLL23_08595 [Chitinophagaceae bacterium]|nr:hypothetical protein [Chitinophagaceae bacterium]